LRNLFCQCLAAGRKECVVPCPITTCSSVVIGSSCRITAVFQGSETKPFHGYLNKTEVCSYSLRQLSRTVGKLFPKSSSYIRCWAVGWQSTG
jgi:hypothetical protein